MGLPDRGEAAITLINRLDLLERLCDSPRQMRDLVEETGQARSTINRAINELAELDHVHRGPDGIEATITGRLARDQLLSFLRGYDDIGKAQAVLDPLDVDTDIDVAAVIGSEGILATEPASYRPLERIHTDLSEALAIRALVPTLADPRTVSVLYEHVVTDGRPVELVVSQKVYETLCAEFPRQTSAMAKEGNFTISVGELPPYGLTLISPGRHSESTAETMVHVPIYTDRGGLHGVLVNEQAPAAAWATTQYAAVERLATDRTDSFIATTDGGLSVVNQGEGTIGRRLPLPLERAGFRRLDATYFENATVAKPTTAWRAGLSIPEVHAGYAIERRRTDETPGTDDSVVASITNELRSGRNCIVIGPPGSGKSTVCKQVACDWYRANHGAVLYREGGRGRTFDALETLVDTVLAEEGAVLVVVEDAVRPDADAVFEAIDRCSSDETVHWLLDSRVSEWSDRSEPSIDRIPLEAVTLPPLQREDCERLVDHLQRTTGDSIDLPIQQLWSAVGPMDPATETESTHEMVRLIHHLATYADPLSVGPTALDEDVAAVYDDLANVEGEIDGGEKGECASESPADLALSVAILINALNAAGIEIEEGLCYATGTANDFVAIDAVIDRLTGTVLLETETGSYRTVHEEWSTEFLAHLIEEDGQEIAAKRFGSAMSDLLALADDPDRRDCIAHHLGDAWALSSVADDPSRWADEVVEAVYAMGSERASLAPLFGDGQIDSVTLPTACSEELSTERLRMAGNAFLAGGFYERAERAFERLPGDETRWNIERAIGLAKVNINVGEFDEAIDWCKRGLSALEENTCSPADSTTEGREVSKREAVPVLRARLHRCYGDAFSRYNQYTDARAQYQKALDQVDETAHRRLVADIHRSIGEIACKQGDYDRAEAEIEAALELSRLAGDRYLEAKTLRTYGMVPWCHGDDEGARAYFERSLKMHRAIGDRHGVAHSLYNLAIVAKREANYDRSQELLEHSLAGLRAVGDDQNEIRVLGALGLNLMRQGEYKRSQRIFEQWLERSRDTGDQHDEARALNNLGVVLSRRGRYDRARRSFERSLELKREFSDTRGVGRTLGNLAEVEVLNGEFDRAAKLLEEAIELQESFDGVAELATPVICLGTIALRRGDLAEATGHFERARTLADDANESNKLASACLGLAEVALLEGSPNRAATLLEQATTAIDETTSQLTLPIQVLRARVAFTQEWTDEAVTIGREAKKTAELFDAPIWIGRSSRLLAVVAAQNGDLEVAADHLSKALETFEEIEAYPDTIEVGRLLAGWSDDGITPIDRWEERVAAVLKAAPEACHDERLEQRVGTSRSN